MSELLLRLIHKRSTKPGILAKENFMCSDDSTFLLHYSILQDMLDCSLIIINIFISFYLSRFSFYINTFFILKFIIKNLIKNSRKIQLELNIKSVAYSSQGSHTSQLDFCYQLVDGSMTGLYDQHYALSSPIMPTVIIRSTTSQLSSYPIVLCGWVDHFPDLIHIYNSGSQVGVHPFSSFYYDVYHFTFPGCPFILIINNTKFCVIRTSVLSFPRDL